LKGKAEKTADAKQEQKRSAATGGTAPERKPADQPKRNP
jgi:hypothetical protein